MGISYLYKKHGPDEDLARHWRRGRKPSLEPYPFAKLPQSLNLRAKGHSEQDGYHYKNQAGKDSAKERNVNRCKWKRLEMGFHAQTQGNIHPETKHLDVWERVRCGSAPLVWMSRSCSCLVHSKWRAQVGPRESHFPRPHLVRPALGSLVRFLALNTRLIRAGSETYWGSLCGA